MSPRQVLDVLAFCASEGIPKAYVTAAVRCEVAGRLRAPPSIGARTTTTKMPETPPTAPTAAAAIPIPTVADFFEFFFVFENN